jgi:chloramphenicol 3-O-phosphotransferase
VIILVTGVMAAGKSTVAQHLAERFGRTAHVRGDWFRRAVVGGRVEPGGEPSTEADAQLALRYRLGAAAADAYAAAGFTAVVQDIVLGHWLDDYVGYLTGRPLHVVVLDPDAETVRAREAGRDKVGYRGGWTVERLRAELHEGTPRLGLWLDTSHQTVVETVDEIVVRLAEARVR